MFWFLLQGENQNSKIRGNINNLPTVGQKEVQRHVVIVKTEFKRTFLLMFETKTSQKKWIHKKALHSRHAISEPTEASGVRHNDCSGGNYRNWPEGRVAGPECYPQERSVDPRAVVSGEGHEPTLSLPGRGPVGGLVWSVGVKSLMIHRAGTPQRNVGTNKLIGQPLKPKLDG